VTLCSTVFAVWRDHELIFSRVVGLTSPCACGGLRRGGGDSGKNSGALDARPFANTACRTGCRRSDILAQSDHAAKTEVDHHLRSVSEKSAIPKIVDHPKHSPPDLGREAGAPFLHALTHALAS
jgi:hypothetical protein